MRCFFVFQVSNLESNFILSHCPKLNKKQFFFSLIYAKVFEYVYSTSSRSSHYTAHRLWQTTFILSRMDEVQSQIYVSIEHIINDRIKTPDADNAKQCLNYSFQTFNGISYNRDTSRDDSGLRLQQGLPCKLTTDSLQQ